MERGTHLCCLFEIRARLALAALLAIYCPFRALGADDEDKARDEELIRLQIVSDMTDGTDDYFGEYTDLSYADRVTPTPPAPPVTVQKREEEHHHDDEQETAPPPEVPPPEPPPPEPPPGPGP